MTIQYVDIHGNDYGVLETGPDTEENAILDNDFCDNGTDIETYASSTTVSGNTYCNSGGGGDGPISDGTYRITNVNSGNLLEVESARRKKARTSSSGATPAVPASTGTLARKGTASTLSRTQTAAIYSMSTRLAPTRAIR